MWGLLWIKKIKKIICTHTHTHTCAHPHTHTCKQAQSCMHTSTDINNCIHMHTHTHTYTHTHTHAHTHTHLHTHIYTYTNMTTHTHIHTHTHTQCTHTRTHTHAHTHTHLSLWGESCPYRCRTEPSQRHWGWCPAGEPPDLRSRSHHPAHTGMMSAGLPVAWWNDVSRVTCGLVE